MQLRLAGHLAWYDSQKRACIEITVARATWLRELLRELKIPLAEIAVATVNGVAVDVETARVNDTDRVELFPPVGGGRG